METTTICFINQKGGCGKSSSCFHLAGAFAARGLNVLLIDADPQGSLSQGFFGSAAVELLTVNQTLAGLFDDSAFVGAGEIIVPTAFPRVSVLRANQTLAMHNIPSPELSGMRQFALRSFLEDLSGYDVILIDCPPNLYQCSWNALLASDFVVVPVPPEDFATQGLRTIHQAIAQAQTLNGRLRLLGHLVTRKDQRLLVHRSYEAKLRALYGEGILQSTIPEASAFKVAISCRQPVALFSPSSKACHAIDDLAQELLQRMLVQGGQRGVA